MSVNYPEVTICTTGKMKIALYLKLIKKLLNEEDSDFGIQYGSNQMFFFCFMNHVIYDIQVSGQDVEAHDVKGFDEEIFDYNFNVTKKRTY